MCEIREIFSAERATSAFSGSDFRGSVQDPNNCTIKTHQITEASISWENQFPLLITHLSLTYR